MRRVLILALPLLLLSVPLIDLVPTAGAASAERVGTLDLAPLPDGSANGIVGSSAVHLAGKSYLLGGRLANGDYSESIYIYDHATGQVSLGPTLPRVAGSQNGGRQSGAAAEIGGKIYYFGGAALVQADLNGDGQMETVPRSIPDIVEYDPAANTVRKLVEELPAGAWGLSAVTYGGKAYLFGGFSFDITKPGEIQRRDWVLRYDPARTTGKLGLLTTRLSYPVQDAGAAVVGNQAYIFGGLSDNDNSTNPCPTGRRYNEETSSYEEQRLTVCTTDRIMRFDPGAEVVRSFAGTLPQRAQFLTAAPAGSKAYIPGGRLPDGTASASILEFSPSAQPPVRPLQPTLPQGLFGAPATVSADGHIFVFGGRSGGLSDLSDDIVKINPGATAPFPPRNLATSQVSGGLRIAWEPPAYDGDSPILGYRVYRAEPGQNETRLAELSGLSYDDTTARPGAQYVYRVTALNRIGESAAATTSRETDATVPGAVTNLMAYALDGKVDVRWQPPTENGGSAITGYRVYRDGNMLQSLPPSPTQFIDTAVENGGSYTYVVRAVNVKGEGPAAPGRTASPAPVPDAPTGVQGMVDGDVVRLTWTAPASAVAKYVVYRGELPGATEPVGETTTNAYVDPQVVRGRTYYYAVRAENAVGSSPPSSLEAVSLVSKPGAPRNVFAAPLEGAVHLTWQPPADTGEADPSALRYYVSRLDPGASQFRILDTGGDLAATSFTDTSGLLPGREYVYTVTTLNPISSDPSAEARAVPKSITNQRPLAFLETDASEADVGEQIRFSAGKTTDPDGRVAYYLFDFGDGSEVQNTTEPQAVRAFQKDGYYTVSVRAVDDRGGESDPVSVTVKVGEPAETRDDGRNPNSNNGGAVTTPTPTERPGGTPGKIPGPGAALVALALVGAAALAGLRRRP